MISFKKMCATICLSNYPENIFPTQSSLKKLRSHQNIMKHNDIIISELGWNFAAIPGSPLDSYSNAHQRPESDSNQDETSGTRSLSSLLGLANFDLIYISNWSKSKTGINDVSIVMKAIVKKAQITKIETNNSGEYANGQIFEHEITLHPILAEFLVLATVDNTKSMNDNTMKNNEEKGDGCKKIENDSTRLGEGNIMKAFIRCVHEGNLHRAPFEVSRINNCDILDTDIICKESNTKKAIKIPQIFGCIFTLDDDNGLDNGFNSEELDLRLIQSHIEGRVVKEGSIVAFDLPYFPYSCYRGNMDDADNSCIIFLDIEEIKIINQNQNQQSDDHNFVTCTDEASSSSSSSKVNDSISRNRLFYRLGSYASYELIIRPPQGVQQEMSSLQLDKLNETEFEVNKRDDYIKFENEIKVYECPGYDHLFKKLENLAHIVDRKGAPSGILLTGCAGVGKTTLSNNLARALSLSKNKKYKLIPHYISAKDILLSASSSNSTLLLQKIIPRHVVQILKDQRNQLRKLYSCSHESNRGDNSTVSNRENDDVQRETQHDHPYRFMLIIDDIDALLGENEETTGGNIQSDQECSLSLHAIINAFDTLMAMDQETIKIVNNATVSTINFNDSNHCDPIVPPPPFILGICGSESSYSLGDLVRVGRFEQVIEMPTPTQEQREIILTFLLKSILYSSSKPIYVSHDQSPDATKSCPSHYDIDYFNEIIEDWAKLLAPQTVGCVASDLRRICADALIKATARHTGSFFHPLSPIQTSEKIDRNDDDDVSHIILRWDDIRESTRNCIPSQLAQIDVSITRFLDDFDVIGSDGSIDYKRRFDLTWKRFGGYHTMKKRIYRSIVNPWIRYLDTKSGLSNLTNSSKSRTTNENEENDMKNNLDTSPPPGVLFHGPSGCGKTIAAGYLASALGLHIIKIKASDILDQWLGGSEAAIRSVFARARSAAPCVIFFDEIDALATNREESAEHNSSDVHSRVLSTLLNEMDGISNRESHEIASNVLVVAATNRINSIDAALLRPGRLQEHILLSLPTKQDCLQILMQKTKGWNLDEDVVVIDLAEKLCNIGASGADIDGLCREACLNSIQRLIENNPNEDNPTPIVTMEDFNVVLERL